MTAASEALSLDVALATVFIRSGQRFFLFKEQRTTLNAFLRIEDIYALLLTGLSLSFIHKPAPLFVNLMFLAGAAYAYNLILSCCCDWPIINVAERTFVLSPFKNILKSPVLLKHFEREVSSMDFKYFQCNGYKNQSTWRVRLWHLGIIL